MSEAAPRTAQVSIAFSGQLPQLLHYLNCTLAITTYRTRQLVLLRPGPDQQVHTDMDCTSFDTPTGITWETGRLAVATTSAIWEWREMLWAAKAAGLKADSKHDACYLPRRAHFTGNVQLHEMCWAKHHGKAHASAGNQEQTASELWFVATQYSCLATRGEVCSIVPRWRPPFVTVLQGDDRCHLNGLCVRDGVPRYVTALAQTNTPKGWREIKEPSGIVMDVSGNFVLAHGLSMPHSPRYHEKKLWVLESGNGGIGNVDLVGGRYEEVARVPGFTRGLDLVGPYAFIGLSLVRPTSAFAATNISKVPRDQLECGVWVMDTRNGMFVGAVKFTEGVDEIFGVQLIKGTRFPELNNQDLALVNAAVELPQDKQATPLTRA